MTTLRKALLQQALEALRGYRREMQEHQPCDAEVALEAALKQDVPETDCGNIPKEFIDWWDADRLTQTNRFREDSPVYWAWEGWQARAALEQPEQEPVAWRYKPMVGSPWSLSDDGYYISCKRTQRYMVEPLYARPLGPHPDTVRLAYLYSGTQTSSDALVNAEMKLLSGKTLTLEEARAAIDDAMSKPMKY